MDSYCSQNVSELASALINVQKQMAPATKDGKNPFTKSNYATLNSVMEACRDVLLSHGIWLTQLTVPAPVEYGIGHIGLITKLTHAESGQWQSSLTVVPMPKTDPQGMGSAITYARRYALTAMLGMITEDDDGESAKVNPKNMSRPRQVAPRPSNASYKGSNVDAFPDLGEDSQEIPEELPDLEGVRYEFVTAQDGRNCVIASGNTQPNKGLLAGAGFRWNPQRKVWWKYANAV